MATTDDHLKEGLRKLRATTGERYDSAIILWEEANAITAEVARLREENAKLRDEVAKRDHFDIE